MHLSILLHAFIPKGTTIPNRDITTLSLDSRFVQPGSLFIALKGNVTNGLAHLEEAIARGASAVLYEGELPEVTLSNSIPLIACTQLKDKLGYLASHFYHHPSRRVSVVGVTGTSGKTSCTHFIAQLLDQPCGVIGTLGIGQYGMLKRSALTTPDVVTLHATLQQFAEQRVRFVAMEVSSHSIHQQRIQAIPFHSSIFTNLTQDHLDYHGTMAAYAETKRQFLATYPTKHLIINGDDPWGLSWLHTLPTDIPLFVYGTQPSLAVPQRAQYLYADHITTSLKGIEATICSPWGKGRVMIPLMGRFNVSNILPAIATACLSGMPFETILTRLSHLDGVLGRMQSIVLPNTPLIVVDYAHKPDALKNALMNIRSYVKGRLICVFGCGGERDRLKRPMMAQLAEQYADVVIVTNDNPRQEAPEAIVADIMKGFIHPERVICLPDRREAIACSIQQANATDGILIAGRGGEYEQKIGDQMIPFDDSEVVKQYVVMDQ